MVLLWFCLKQKYQQLFLSQIIFLRQNGMIKILLCCTIIFISTLIIAQSKLKKIELLKSRTDLKVAEVSKDILRIEYPDGKIVMKNVADYKSSLSKQAYAPTFDSTIIDLTTIDTSLYFQKYKFWQEVPIHNWEFDHVLVNDINNNGKPELYGARKFFQSEQEPVTVYELNNSNKFAFVYQYDSVFQAKGTFDVDKDGREEIHLLGMKSEPIDSVFYNTWDRYLFFRQPSETDLANELSFIFEPWRNNGQQNDNYFGDWDGDYFTDQIFIRLCCPPSIYFYEFNPLENNFDSVYQYDFSNIDNYYGGFSIGDFDGDGKTESLAGSVHGKLLCIENNGNNSYEPTWTGEVETYNAYLCAQTNDIDGNGKKEIWIGGDAFYNGNGITRITLFEANGDNSYQIVGRIDLIGVFSFDAGNIQPIDIDKDGTEEVAICIDGNFIVLKFNGSKNHQSYEVNYIKQTEAYPEGEYLSYFGATMADLLNNGSYEILISMRDIKEQPNYNLYKYITKIYKPDSLTSVIDDKLLPSKFNLYQNYPNPFNPNTTIKFNTGHIGNVSIKVHDIIGKEIKILINKNLPAGEHSVQWNGKDDKGNALPSGIYFIRMIADNFHKTIKTILLK